MQQNAELYKKMKELYRIRNKIVHGITDDVGDETVEQMEIYMRRSLTKYLSDTENNSLQTQKQFVDYLDFIKAT